eukprot:scaffold3743_cov389-Prasinococcus_capsulatus_cf.AAC.7
MAGKASSSSPTGGAPAQGGFGFGQAAKPRAGPPATGASAGGFGAPPGGNAWSGSGAVRKLFGAGPGSPGGGFGGKGASSPPQSGGFAFGKRSTAETSTGFGRSATAAPAGFGFGKAATGTAQPFSAKPQTGGAQSSPFGFGQQSGSGSASGSDAGRPTGLGKSSAAFGQPAGVFGTANPKPAPGFAGFSGRPPSDPKVSTPKHAFSFGIKPPGVQRKDSAQSQAAGREPVHSAWPGAKDSAEGNVFVPKGQVTTPPGSAPKSIFARLTPGGPNKSSANSGFTFGRDTQVVEGKPTGKGGDSLEDILRRQANAKSQKMGGRRGPQDDAGALQGTAGIPRHEDHSGSVADEAALKRAAIASIPKFEGGGAGGKQGTTRASSKTKAGLAPGTDEAEDEDAAKRAAIASIPKFGGSDQGQSTRAPQRSKGKSKIGTLAMSAEALEKRAARFGVDPAPQPRLNRQPALRTVGQELQQSAAVTDGDLGDEEGEMVKAKLVGACEEMCPWAEYERRARIGDFTQFEKDEEGKPDPELMVKKYVRSVDLDLQNESVRTIASLERTMSHLLQLLDRPNVRFKEVQKFVWDRSRSIRQDLNLTHTFDRHSVRLHEKMVRFHVLAEHELVDDKQTVQNPDGFNSHLNVEQLYKCLTSLMSLYDKHRARGVFFPTEPEFRAYQILLQLDRHGRYHLNVAKVLEGMCLMTNDILRTDPVQRALKAFVAVRLLDYASFFRILDTSTYLEACLLEKYWNAVSAHAVHVTNDTGSRGSSIPLERLRAMTRANSVDVIGELCAHHGLAVGRNPEGDWCLLVKEGRFQDPEEEFTFYKQDAVSRKQGDRTRRQVAEGNSEPPVELKLSCGQPSIQASAHTAAVSGAMERQTEQKREHEERQRLAAEIKAQREATEKRLEETRQKVLEEEQRRAQQEAERLVRARAQEEARKAQIEQMRHEEELKARAAAVAAEKAREEAQAAALARAEEERRAREMEEAEQRRRIAAIEEQRRLQQEKLRREAEERRAAAAARAAAEAERQRQLREAQERERARLEKARRQLCRAVAKVCGHAWRTKARALHEARVRDERALAALRSCHLSLFTSGSTSREERTHDGLERAKNTNMVAQLARASRRDLWNWNERWQRMDLAALIKSRLQTGGRFAQGPIFWKCLLSSESFSSDSGDAFLLSKWLEAKVGLNETTRTHVNALPPQGDEKWGVASCVSAVSADARALNAVAGSTAAIVVLNGDYDRTSNRERLRQLSLSLPPGGRVPILAVAMPQRHSTTADVEEGDRERVLLTEMGLDLAPARQENRVSSYRVMILPGSIDIEPERQTAGSGTRHAEWERIQGQLTECFEWLLDRMPDPPRAQVVVGRDLVDGHLERAMSKLMVEASSASPDDCVRELNSALSTALQCAQALSKLRVAQWPPMELVEYASADSPGMLGGSSSFLESIHAIEQHLSKAMLPDFSSMVDSCEVTTHQMLASYLQRLDQDLSREAADRQAFALLFEDGDISNPAPWALVFRRLCYSVIEPLSSLPPAKCYVYPEDECEWSTIMQGSGALPLSIMSSPYRLARLALSPTTHNSRGAPASSHKRKHYAFEGGSQVADLYASRAFVSPTPREKPFKKATPTSPHVHAGKQYSSFPQVSRGTSKVVKVDENGQGEADNALGEGCAPADVTNEAPGSQNILVQRLAEEKQQNKKFEDWLSEAELASLGPDTGLVQATKRPLMGGVVRERGGTNSLPTAIHRLEEALSVQAEAENRMQALLHSVSLV